ncbi:hypothetical protein [Brucella anthropi]|uniref:hypothetical protein n=1 Tax=Brucella anthropi TaxID=529 RepID=UPI0005565ED6|nr:hypothetical protein [Brucella anthropi]KAB2737355.1 hypothetical protein F9K89_08605 [Brucella anthropi]
MLEAVRPVGAPPALIVGDTGLDIATAKAAGLPIVIVDILGRSPATLDPRAQSVISDFSKLVDLVLGEEGRASE